MMTSASSATRHAEGVHNVAIGTYPGSARLYPMPFLTASQRWTEMRMEMRAEIRAEMRDYV